MIDKSSDTVLGVILDSGAHPLSDHSGPELRLNHSHDAVVVIPGIMGSTLVDTATKETLWGLNHLGWYGRAWSNGSSLRDLADLEPGRVEPQGLLRFPAWAPLGYFEPYDRLIRHLKEMVHPRAVHGFAYDWRLPVLHNARLLARAAQEHLAMWRATQDHERLRVLQADPSPARLVLVAHSMGGLLARALPLVEGTEDEAGEIPTVTDDIRATITLGTPFRGAAKAATVLANGRGLLPPRQRMMRLARQLPGIYDLLPSYKCVDEGDHLRPLTAEDVAGFGGNPAEAQRAFDDRTRLDTQSLVGHRLVIGVEQPTVACLRLGGGTVEGLDHTFRPTSDGKIVHDFRGVPAHFPSLGDGTVPVDSAIVPGAPMDPRAQQHGSLANVDEAISSVRFVVIGEPQGPLLAPRGQVGIDAPDVVCVGAEWPVVVTGVKGPDDATCRVIDAETGKNVARPRLEKRDGQWQFIVTVPDKHLYEIVVDGGSGSPLKRMTLATSHDEPAEDLGDDD